MDTIIVAGFVIRSCVVILGVIAIVSLAYAKAKRGAQWTRKMKDIWLCHFLAVYGITQGNVELLFRHVFPTTSLLFFIFVLVWTIRSVFHGSAYTEDSFYHES